MAGQGCVHHRNPPKPYFSRKKKVTVCSDRIFGVFSGKFIQLKKTLEISLPDLKE
jgi:uncharacterized membrane protein